VQPQRVLVEREPRADAESGGGDLEPRTRRLEREREAHREQQHDAEHQMVHVQAALRLDAARPPRHLRAAHQARARADEQEREQERGEHDDARPRGARLEEVLALDPQLDLGDHHAAKVALSRRLHRREYLRSRRPLPSDGAPQDTARAAG
jgi:hypothetical protein